MVQSLYGDNGLKKLTHIDLFAGIGGFALGFERAGIETLAHVEIDEACQAVLKSHWSDRIIFSDVTDAGSHNLPYADIISYGSPCQDMSIAGRREGLTGKRSVLFYEAARIIREINPRYSIWENVPGALLSNKGLDFRAVLEELLQTDVPMPQSGRWASSGVVRAGQKELAWRVLDSQYFGVPQRRRRIFLVLCTRGDSAAEILFERKGSEWNAPPHREPKQSSSTTIAYSPFKHYVYEQSSIAATIHNYRQLSGSEHLIVDNIGVRRLTPVECCRLQGFPDDWNESTSNAGRYRQIGNAVTVNVTHWIGKRIVDAVAKNH